MASFGGLSGVQPNEYEGVIVSARRRCVVISRCSLFHDIRVTKGRVVSTIRRCPRDNRHGSLDPGSPKAQLVWNILNSTLNKKIPQTSNSTSDNTLQIKTMSPSIASRSPSPVQDFLGFGEDFVEAPERVVASIKTVDFGGLLDPPLLLHEDLADGCGGMLWPAGMRLAKYLIKMKKEEIRNAESMCVSSYVQDLRPVSVNLQLSLFSSL